MFENLKVIEKIPNPLWLFQLRKDDVVWLVKEKTFGIIEWEYRGERSGGMSGRFSLGRIGFRIYKNNQWVNQNWIISASGKGIDSSLLMLPVEGHLSDAPVELNDSEVEQLKRHIDLLEHRIDLIERGLWLADALSGLEPTTNYPRRNAKPKP